MIDFAPSNCANSTWQRRGVDQYNPRLQRPPAWAGCGTRPQYRRGADPAALHARGRVRSGTGAPLMPSRRTQRHEQAHGDTVLVLRRPHSIWTTSSAAHRRHRADVISVRRRRWGRVPDGHPGRGRDRPRRVAGEAAPAQERSGQHGRGVFQTRPSAVAGHALDFGHNVIPAIPTATRAYSATASTATGRTWARSSPTGGEPGPRLTRRN
jgi:hypothetical protein